MSLGPAEDESFFWLGDSTNACASGAAMPAASDFCLARASSAGEGSRLCLGEIAEPEPVS